LEVKGIRDILTKNALLYVEIVSRSPSPTEHLSAVRSHLNTFNSLDCKRSPQISSHFVGILLTGRSYTHCIDQGAQTGRREGMYIRTLRGWCRVCTVAFVVCAAGDRLVLAQAYQQTNLVSDIQGLGQNPTSGQPDTQLVNPWGLVATPTSPWWVSDNNAGVSTLYNGQGVKQGLVVNIPSPVSGVAGTPTGIVFTGATGFTFQADGKTIGAAFTFVTEDGTIVAWGPGINPLGLPNDAFIVVNNSSNPSAAEGAVYKGATIAQTTAS
jgi:hypothetical protein